MFQQEDIDYERGHLKNVMGISHDEISKRLYLFWGRIRKNGKLKKKFLWRQEPTAKIYVYGIKCLST